MLLAVSYAELKLNYINRYSLSKKKRSMFIPIIHLFYLVTAIEYFDKTISFIRYCYSRIQFVIVMIVFAEQLFDDSSEDNIIITILERFHNIMMIGVFIVMLNHIRTVNR